MASNYSNRNRNCNAVVRFDLGLFTEALFGTLGARASFTGPGPVSLEWRSYTATQREHFAIEHLAEELFSKFDDGLPSKDKRARAIQRFREGETLCALTNCKFSPNAAGQPAGWLDDFAPFPDLPEDRAVFARARSIISKVLGSFPGWETVLQFADFGPGSTTRLTARQCHRSNKWSGKPHVTFSSLSPLSSAFAAFPLLQSRLEGPGAEICPGNKLGWVPKNYKTDRTIATEPDWNMFLQKGLGALIRRKLKRVHQDLDDQSTNRFLAAVGSIDGSLSTLDMSMASDTVAYRLVEYLVRPDWFEALTRVRCAVGFYTHDGVVNPVLYEKFSSMGNGCTFELESLIFYGLLRAVSELSGEADHRLYVYGDDVVVPSGMSSLAIEYLQKAGFMLNLDKSFTSGPFRESCGGHYFEGDDVTPFYVREAVDKLDRLFLLHNNVYRWFNRHPGICHPDQVRALLVWIRGHAPEQWRKPRLLTEDVGDGAFIGTFDEVTPTPVGKSRRKRGWEGWRAETLQYKDVTESKEACAECVAASMDLTDGCSIHSFGEGTCPDLASLWAMERREPSCWSGPESLMFFVKHSLIPRSRVSRVMRETPRQKRSWFVGTQVLPWKWGQSWW